MFAGVSSFFIFSGCFVICSSSFYFFSFLSSMFCWFGSVYFDGFFNSFCYAYITPHLFFITLATGRAFVGFFSECFWQRTYTQQKQKKKKFPKTPVTIVPCVLIKCFVIFFFVLFSCLFLSNLSSSLDLVFEVFRETNQMRSNLWLLHITRSICFCVVFSESEFCNGTNQKRKQETRKKKIHKQKATTRSAFGGRFRFAPFASPRS